MRKIEYFNGLYCSLETRVDYKLKMSSDGLTIFNATRTAFWNPSPEEARNLELNLNVVHGHKEDYVAIGNALYEFHAQMKAGSIETTVSLGYLQKLAMAYHSDVRKNPGAYLTL